MYSNVVSNADNFSDYISSGVDPRTGMYSISINLGTFSSYRGVGEDIPIVLNYSAASTLDIGFGRGWNIPISRFDKEKNFLSLSTGQAFEVEWNHQRNEYDIPYRKLKDLRVFYLDESEEIQVVYKDGKQEFISYNEGITTRVVSANGLEIGFEYGQKDFQQVLWHIYDKNADRELEIDWWTSKWKTVVTHKVLGTVRQTIEIDKTGNGNIYTRLDAIRFPGIDSTTHFEYRYIGACNYDVIERVAHANGLVEEMLYYDQGHYLPQDAPIDTFPYVHRHTVFPGENQPPQITEYEFSDQNYLGFSSDRAWVAGEDTLFKAHRDYTYSSTEIVNGTKSVTREYNKYHLMNSAHYYEGGHLYKEESYTYFADLDQGIDLQPATYSLAKSQTTTHYLGGQSRSFTSEYDYDEYANLLSETQPDGSKMVRSYYPASGEGTNCPAEPNGFVSLIKTETFTPNNGDTARTKVFTYSSLPKLDDPNGYFVLLASQSDENQSEDFEYYSYVGNLYTYGLLKTKTLRYNGYETSITCHYDFGVDGMTSSVLTRSHDNLETLETKTLDYFFGEPTKHIDEQGIVTRFSYDVLGRKVAAVTAPGTPFEASQTITYHVGDGVNSMIQVDTKGNALQTRFNNAGKVIEVLQTPYGETPYTVQSCLYDDFGLLVSKTETDWLDGVALPLTSTYQYDVNGEISSVTHPDGRKEQFTQDPVTLTTHYQHESGLSNQTLMSEWTQYDLSGREINKKTYDASGALLAKTDYHYDGYDNLLTVTDTEGRVIKHRYDRLDRLVETTRIIDGQNVTENYHYPDFTRSDVPSEVLVDGASQGQQTFDGLMRLMQKTTLNAGTTHYSYSGVSPEPTSINLASGSQLHFTNNSYLHVPLTISVSGQTQLDSGFSYDAQSGLPLSNQNLSGTRLVSRDSYNRVLTETMQIDGEERTANFRYSLLGKLLSRTDYFGNTTAFYFDNLGRLAQAEEVVSGIHTSTTFGYDVFSRPIQYTTLRAQDSAEIRLEYNAFGVETKREARFNGSLIFTIDQVFNQRILLDSRTFTQHGESTQETFFYDDLARLTLYQVSGPNAPQDDYGNVIVEQSFTHDVYGNITQATSVFSNGSNNTATFSYPSNNPQRLERLTNTHNYYPSSVDFSYDEAGNLLNDEKGRQYSYNALGQMSSVSENGSVLSEYQYDAGGRVVTQSVEQSLIYLFYLNNQLINERNESAHSSFHNIGPGLTSRNVNSPQEEIHQFSFGNSQGSVLETYSSSDGEEREKTTRKYTPYGEG
ncbi:RHS repeat protein [Vibrio sp. S234-5]|uniref:RHS repeat domain-containing protein n=1 Tax=Vibrio sp. S234-5 TaxID=1616781 RepID=UPI0005EDF038|nr:RHS repeat protein [Vibrio sp. S234-5]KJR27832.1 hypothetical protein UF06_14485 [Vibrio sp. S234-5]